MVKSGHRDKGACLRGAATTNGHRRRAALCVVSMATRNKVVCGTG
jgi:hypothetical protein